MGCEGLSSPPALLSYAVTFQSLPGLCPPWVCKGHQQSSPGEHGLERRTPSEDNQLHIHKSTKANDWKAHNQTTTTTPHQKISKFWLNVQPLGRSAEPFPFPAFLIAEPYHEHSASLLPPPGTLPNSFPLQGSGASGWFTSPVNGGEHCKAQTYHGIIAVGNSASSSSHGKKSPLLIPNSQPKIFLPKI